MPTFHPLTSIALVVAFTSSVHAESVTGLRFSHADWELACSNTRQCQLAGYQADESEPGVTVLLTRRAGANQPIHGQVQLAQADEVVSTTKTPAKLNLHFKINQRALGKVSLDASSLTALLSAEQTQALVQALAGKAQIVFENGQQSWRLSDQGAAAVLLKADEFQGRLGTSEAWIKKGSKPENTVLPALPKPTIQRAKLPKALAQDASFAQKNYRDLLAALRQSVKRDDCPALAPDAEAKPELSSLRLSETQFLISGLCWRAAYNEGEGYWVVDATKPFKASLVTANASEFNDGLLLSSQKGRGIGDCWSSQEWVWDGRNFLLSSSSFSGMCKQIAPGGAWQLMTYETELK